eukprot:Rhum_TRINITY_DN22955_c0_g1::Rhum_TRINITY_DN22955_c0_g1_i1::g.176403::m.176403
MAVNLRREFEAYVERRVELLLDVIAAQPLRSLSQERTELMWYARWYDPVYYRVQRRGMEGTFVEMLNCTDQRGIVPTVHFLQGACLYQDNYGKLLLQKLVRCFGLVSGGVGGEAQSIEAKHAVSQLLCVFGRNENIHQSILEHAYSLADLYRSRDWAAERVAGVLSAYAFSDPMLVQQVVGVTAKTDVVQRANAAYLKSKDLIARRMSLQTVKASGLERAQMTNDDIVALRDKLRCIGASFDVLPYFTATTAYAMARHCAAWGVKGQLAAVVQASVLAGLVSAFIGGVYTREYLEQSLETRRATYGLAWDREQRKQRLRVLNKTMQAVPGCAVPELGDSIPERYRTLEAVTNELWAERSRNHTYAFCGLLLLGAKLPWWRVVPLMARKYTMLRLGPRFHRMFPALSMKYSKRPRAVLPYIIAPTLAVKAYEFWNPDGMFYAARACAF